MEAHMEALGVWNETVARRMDAGNAAGVGVAALWGHTVTRVSGAGRAYVFGGEHSLPAGVGGRRSSSLFGLELDGGTSTRLSPVDAIGGQHPAGRRQHAASAVSHDGLVVTGGLGFHGRPLGDAWVGRLSSRARVSWSPSGLESHWAALLARTGHSITALPAPPGPLYLRAATDAAFLIFGGLASARVAAIARASAYGNTTSAAFAQADEADAREPDASLVPLNDVLLLTLGAHGKWRLVRLADASEVASCHSASPPLDVEARSGASALQLQPRRTATRQQRQRSLLPDTLAWATIIREADPQAASGQTTIGERAGSGVAPCPRAGHSAHLYSGPLRGLGLRACLLVLGGSSGATERHSDLWLLPVDDSWARPRDEPHRPAAMPWQRVSYAGSLRSPPRAYHASALHGRRLYVVGGEAPVNGGWGGGGVGGSARWGSGEGESAGRGEGAPGAALWQLDLPTLRWVRLWTPGGAAAVGPRPCSGAVALMAAIQRGELRPRGGDQGEGENDGASDIDSASDIDGDGDDDDDGDDEGGMLMLIGGQGGNDDGALRIWRYALGKQCHHRVRATEPGASAGLVVPGCATDPEQCDASRGVCVCTNGRAPPCATHQVGTVWEDGAIQMVGAAWAVVGVSLVSARLGALLVRRVPSRYRRHGHMGDM